MTRQQFIELWVREVAAGRQRAHPDISPAESAAASVHDAEFAKLLWRRYRVVFKSKSPQELLVAIRSVRESRRAGYGVCEKPRPSLRLVQ